MTTRNELLEQRNQVAEILNAFGYTKELSLGEKSEMSYILTESANGTLQIVLTADCDMSDIFEGIKKPAFTTSSMSRGFNMEKFMIYTILF